MRWTLTASCINWVHSSTQYWTPSVFQLRFDIVDLSIVLRRRKFSGRLNDWLSYSADVNQFLNASFGIASIVLRFNQSRWNSALRRNSGVLPRPSCDVIMVAMMSSWSLWCDRNASHWLPKTKSRVKSPQFFFYFNRNCYAFFTFLINFTLPICQLE